MITQIVVSSKVRLKSGGPRMTVTRLGWYGRVLKAECEWFAGRTPKHRTFPLVSLVLDE